jgi:hypothetical protein
VSGPRTTARAILLAGAVAGALDITAAFAFSMSRGGTPVGVLRSIASGVLGAASFQGGTASAALGLLLHFVIATGAAAVYALAARRIAFLTRHPVPSGLAYGVVVYFVMNLVVLPLSRVAQRPFTPSPIMIAIHMLCVGLPIALVLRRAGPAARDALS